MKIVVQAAISADGFVATISGNTDWVKDLDLFEQACKQYGCVVMGSTTYSEFEGPAFDDVQHIVLSNQSQDPKEPNVHFVTSVDSAVSKAKQLGFDKLLIIGGGKTNGSFLKAGVVSEILLDIHPLVLGQGIKPFEGFDDMLKLDLVAVKEYEEFICATYKVHAWA